MDCTSSVRILIGMSQLQKKNFDSPDKVTAPNNAKIETVALEDKTVIRATFQPGWKWSVDMQPTAGTETCQMHHFGYQISGVLRVRSADGAEIESGSGDVVDIPPGHDAWVAGDEPVVLIDFGGAVR